MRPGHFKVRVYIGGEQKPRESDQILALISLEKRGMALLLQLTWLMDEIP
jgi:hypothetical protein